jgi:hypothetical protein
MGYRKTECGKILAEFWPKGKRIRRQVSASYGAWYHDGAKEVAKMLAPLFEVDKARCAGPVKEYTAEEIAALEKEMGL